MSEPLKIRNTEAHTIHPWPEDTSIQGSREYDFTLENGRRVQRGAFVEVSVEPTYIRADAPNLEAAETKAWNRYQEILACDKHEYEPRGYTNGAGFCRKCNCFTSQVFSGAELSQFCVVCSVGTTAYRYSQDAYWDADEGRVVENKDNAERTWYCKEHNPFKKEQAEYFVKLEETMDSLTDEDIAETITAIFNVLEKGSLKQVESDEDTILINDFE